MATSQKIIKDQRGEVQINVIKGEEYVASYTKAGAYRGADIHAGRQFNLVLRGRFEVTWRRNRRDVVKRYGPGEFFVIPAKTPHLLKAVTDAILIEGKSGGYRKKYYGPYRKIIEGQLKNNQ
jgi:quercetin dioxygenase-like cupin family protein